MHRESAWPLQWGCGPKLKNWTVMSKETDELVEAMAQALWIAEKREEMGFVAWDQAPPQWHSRYCKLARGALDLLGADYEIRPKRKRN